MKIISLDPFITDFIVHSGLGQTLAACTHDCSLPKEFAAVKRVTQEGEPPAPELGNREILWDKAKETGATLLLVADWNTTMQSLPLTPERAAAIESLVKEQLGAGIKLILLAPRTLESMEATLEHLAVVLKVPLKGRELAQKIQAQAMNLADNFYDRMKSKKVSFLSSVLPLRLAGFWIPDLIKLCSAQSQNNVSGSEDREVTWQDILSFKPDVIVVAPRDFEIKEALKNFKILEKMPGWEDIPAVKRGEVIFTEGKKHFYRPGSALIDSMGVLVSGIAGLESGYITERDSFYRLRWLEMQRHRV